MDIFGISVQKTRGRFEEYFTCYQRACQEFDRQCSNLYQDGRIILIQICWEERKQIFKLREIAA
ncbi:MAG: hypothetical protein ACLFRL_02050 [Desulfohalobiaceae bacterium]